MIGHAHPHRRRRRRYGERAVWPDTVMSRAFMRALADWTLVHHEDADATVMLPTGRVTAEQLIQVLRALEAARQELHSTQHKEDYHHA